MELARLSTLRTGRPYQSADIPNNSLLLEAKSTRQIQCGREDCVNENSSDTIGKKKTPAIFRLVGQCLNKLPASVALLVYL